MIIYTVTLKVSPEINDEWVKWMKEEHIPRVIETGCFTHYNMYRLIEDNATDGASYSIQYFAKDLASYLHYKETYAPALQKETHEAYGGKFTASRTLMEEI